MCEMKKVIVPLLMALALASTGPANALTFKKGQVLGSDGKLYDGASPQVIENLINYAERTGETAGINGKSVFVVVDVPGQDSEKEVVFISFQDLAGKDKKGIQETVLDKVVGHQNAGTNLGFNAGQIGAELDRETASAAQIAAADAAREAAISNFEELVESLEGSTIDEIEKATGSTLISVEGDCAVACTETFYQIEKERS